jgi:hypothetical protein
MKKFMVIGPTVLVGGFTINTIRISLREDLNRCKDDINKLSKLYAEHKSIADRPDLKSLIAIRYHNLLADKADYEKQVLEEWLNLPFHKRIVTTRPQIDIRKMQSHALRTAYERLDRDLERY